MKNIINAIRKLCETDQGFIELFDKDKSYIKLRNLTEDNHKLLLFSKLVYGKSRYNLICLINDVYSLKEYESKIINDLITDGLNYDDAMLALEIFYKAFGFPGHRDILINPINEFISYEGDTFKSIYNGETKEGKEYGIGIRKNYFEGESCGWDECVWINGKMLGYCYSLDIEFGEYKTKKYGFIVNDTYVGKYMNVYEDGSEGYMNGEQLNLK